MISFKKNSFFFERYLLSSKSLNWIGCFILCTWGVFNAFRPMILSRLSLTQLGSGDTWLSNYLLEHSFQLLINKNYIGSLWSPPFFFPYQGAIAFSENFWGAAPLYWLLRSFLEADTAFQMWMISTLVLCFFSFFYLACNLGIHFSLSALGSFLFAFGLPRIQQISHPQLLPQFFTPLAFLCLWNFSRQPTSKRLFSLLIFIYLQVLSSIYLGWFLVFSFTIVFFLIYGFDSNARQALRRYLNKHYKIALGLLSTWAALMLALLAPYLSAKKLLGDRSYTEVESMLPRFESWFLPAEGSLWWQPLKSLKDSLPMYWEHPLFLGFLPLALIGLVLWILTTHKHLLPLHKAKLAQTCLLVALFIFIISFRLPNGWSFWKIIYDFVPGASAIRAVTRIWAVFYFYLLVGLLLIVDSFLFKIISQKQWRLLILGVIFFVGITEQTMLQVVATPKIDKLNEITEIRSLIAQQCDVAYVEPDVRRPLDTHISAMWASLQANVPVVNGYSGNLPLAYPGGATASASPYEIAEWLKNTDVSQVCWIVPQIQQGVSQPIFESTQAKSGQSSQSFISWSFRLPLEQHQNFSQEIYLFELPKSVHPGATIIIPVIVKNTSNFTWRSQGHNPTNFAYRWFNSQGQTVSTTDYRTPLPQDLLPGKAVAINASINAPNIPGKYKLMPTMVEENVAWFHDQGAQSQEFVVIIEPPSTSNTKK